MRTEFTIALALGLVCGTQAGAPTYSCFDPPDEGQTNPLGEGFEDVVGAECCEALIDERSVITWHAWRCQFFLFLLPLLLYCVLCGTARSTFGAVALACYATIRWSSYLETSNMCRAKNIALANERESTCVLQTFRLTELRVSECWRAALAVS